MAEIVFWILLITVTYAYIGYPLIIAIVNTLTKSNTKKPVKPAQTDEPQVTLFIAAYNEIEFIDAKIRYYAHPTIIE